MLNNENKKEKNEKFITIGEASRLSSLCIQTLRKLADEGKIKSFKTPSGQRRFDKQDFNKMLNIIPSIEKKTIDQRENFIYVRVSSKKQHEDLIRQLEFIKSRDSKYSSYTIIQDIASGLNFKRKGLETLLDGCSQGSIGEVIVAHRDRLSRFGFELIEQFITKSGGTITIIDEEEFHKSSEQELAEDLLSIVHIYSCRQMGKRRYKCKSEEEKTGTGTTRTP